MRILIAEDDCTSRIVLMEVLKKNGHDVVVTTDGAEAWSLLRRPDAPKLAILDWMMPNMSGLDVCRLVRAHPTDLPPYLIMLTSKGEKEDIVQGLEAGADDYLAKPFVVAELRARVEVGRRLLDLQAAMANKVNELTRWQNQMVRELKVAAQLQKTLQSTTPLITSQYEVRTLYWPCQHVGGDFFNAVSLPDGRLCVYIGDVAGHGVGPAMIASLIKVIVSDVIHVMSDASPAALCNEINARFREQVSDPDVYATLFLLFHDAEKQLWSGMNCGHPPPFLVDARCSDHSAELAAKGGLPIGVAPSDAGAPVYNDSDVVSVSAREGDTLFLFTDGLLDARRQDHEETCRTEHLFSAFCETVQHAQTFDLPLAVLNRVAALGYRARNDDCCAISVQLRKRTQELRMDLSFALDADGIQTAETAVVRTLEESDWPEAQRDDMLRLVHRYIDSVCTKDRPSVGTRLSLQVWLNSDLCRLIFSGEGHEVNKSNRLADLSLRTISEGDSKGIAETSVAGIDLFRRDERNIGCFTFPRSVSRARV